MPGCPIVDRGATQTQPYAGSGTRGGWSHAVYNVYQGRVDSDSVKSYVCALKVCFRSFCLITLFELLAASRLTRKPYTDWINEKMLRTMPPASRTDPEGNASHK